MNVVLERKHNGTQSEVMVHKVIENSLQLDTPPVKAREDVREEEKVSVPDKEVEEGNMGRLIKPAASCQENNAI